MWLRAYDNQAISAFQEISVFVIMCHKTNIVLVLELHCNCYQSVSWRYLGGILAVSWQQIWASYPGNNASWLCLFHSLELSCSDRQRQKQSHNRRYQVCTWHITHVIDCLLTWSTAHCFCNSRFSSLGHVALGVVDYAAIPSLGRLGNGHVTVPWSRDLYDTKGLSFCHEEETKLSKTEGLKS